MKLIIIMTIVLESQNTTWLSLCLSLWINFGYNEFCSAYLLFIVMATLVLVAIYVMKASLIRFNKMIEWVRMWRWNYDIVELRIIMQVLHYTLHARNSFPIALCIKVVYYFNLDIHEKWFSGSGIVFLWCCNVRYNGIIRNSVWWLYVVQLK